MIKGFFLFLTKREVPTIYKIVRVSGTKRRTLLFGRFLIYKVRTQRNTRTFSNRKTGVKNTKEPSGSPYRVSQVRSLRTLHGGRLESRKYDN